MRLIDADALKAKIEEMQKEFDDGGRNDIGIGYAAACNDCAMYLDGAETISSGLTMDGHWIECGIGGTVMCSICKFVDFFAKRDRVMLFGYCPGCGARMKGAEQNATD